MGQNEPPKKKRGTYNRYLRTGESIPKSTFYAKQKLEASQYVDAVDTSISPPCGANDDDNSSDIDGGINFNSFDDPSEDSHDNEDEDELLNDKIKDSTAAILIAKPVMYHSNVCWDICVIRCFICRSASCQRVSPARCQDCDCLCQSEACFASHKITGICDKAYQCRKCSKRVERKQCPKDQHRCDEVKCRGCKKFVKADHLCFIEKKAPKKPINHLIFFDLETDQSSNIHKVNFAVAQYSDGNQRVFKGMNALNDLCTFFFKSGHKGFTCITHNMKGFDGQFMAIRKWIPTESYPTRQQIDVY
ncbi:hypothetical protein JTE90_003452 [Oedothorax gibbosus]|uniref:DNA-directed DNA polymerase n=1 Tax=Oedothorax gibbosus TaxID=931172 RepID=A0AAV6TYR0_9ARAC|nr:hypothetical protein JTE90_003452 [Oedothorax gibbosus]